MFVGSETGDSHLLWISTNGTLQVLDTFTCIAPIGDAILADLDESNEPVIITCSGAGSMGSLRVVRTGANVEEISSIDGIDQIRKIFPLYGPHGG